MNNSNETKKHLDVTVLNFIKTDNPLGLIDFLKSMPLKTQFDIRPKFITFSNYKIDDSRYQIDTTVNGWMTTYADTKSLSLFLFGKVDSTFFDWK